MSQSSIGSASLPLVSHTPQRQIRRETGHANVGEVERWISLMAGGAMTVYGLSRQSLGGLGLALVGGSFVYRGATGYCGAYQALGIDTSQSRGPERQRQGPARRQGRGERGHQPSPGGALPLLARLLQPAPDHAAPQVGRDAREWPVALGRQRADGCERRVGRRDHQRAAERVDRLAVGGRFHGRHGGLGPFPRDAQRSRHRDPRRAEVRSAREASSASGSPGSSASRRASRSGKTSATSRA